MTIVSNTSPISNLAAIGRLSLLEQVYGQIIIPQAVENEIAKVATIYSQAALVPSLPWITICSVSDSSTVNRLQGKKLDAGEESSL